MIDYFDQILFDSLPLIRYKNQVAKNRTCCKKLCAVNRRVVVTLISVISIFTVQSDHHTAE